MRESGQFRFTKEILLHHVEQGGAERLVGLELSQGGVATLRKNGVSEDEIGITSLRETEQLFQTNTELDFTRMVVRHPLLGSYDVPGLLRFMAAHEERHQSQIREVLADAGFSGST